MEETIRFIKDCVLRQNLNIGHFLNLKALMPIINPVIRNNLEAALNQLIDEGFFEEENGHFRLTRQGFEVIYGNQEKQMNYTINFIYEATRRQRLNIGEFFNIKAIMPITNPVISNNIEEAFNQLVEEGFFEVENESLKLTQSGFNEIYGQ